MRAVHVCACVHMSYFQGMVLYTWHETHGYAFFCFVVRGMDSSLQQGQQNRSHNVHESAVEQQAHAPLV